MSLRSVGVEDQLSPFRAEIEAELARILNSSQFRNAPVLQSLLRFITQRALDSNNEALNEYVIASEVFGRSADFDSSVDTIVRTQAYRLRLKLNEYYLNEGANDPVGIEIPKGHYVPSFHARRQPPPSQNGTPEADPPLSAQALSSRTIRPYLAAVFAVALAVVAFLGGLAVGEQHTQRAAPADPPNEVDSFWQHFLGADRQPVVAYTNALFLATDSGDLFRFVDGAISSRGASVDSDTAKRNVPNRDLLKLSGPTYYEDDMTGVGEVPAAVAITKALYRIGAHPVFKRSLLISTSDLENHNVIFLGSPFVNRILNDLPGKPRFLFKMPKTTSSLWGGTIVNTDPRPDEAATYSIERAPGSHVVTVDYGLVSQSPGLTNARKLIVLAGLTTTGTQAAAEFVTSVEGIRKMTEQLPDKRWPANFDYLLRVRLSQGLDIVRSECVAFRASPQ